MRQKISQIGGVSLLLFSSVTFPTLAQTNTSQSGSISATVTGENNQVYQTIEQTIINHPGRGFIQRNSENSPKKPQKNSRSSSHRHSDSIEHPRRNRY